MTLTATYPLAALAVGQFFTVNSRLQHARVAASEYGRKHGMAFSCRVQEDGSMRVYRCERSQAVIDQRGRNGKRRIDYQQAPTQDQFNTWLATFDAGQLQVISNTMHDHYLLMQAWLSLYALQTGQAWRCGTDSNGNMLVTRS
jgi:hypothetical protein